MSFQVRMQSPAVRDAKIRASVQASQETRDFYDFRNQKTLLRLVRIAQDLLVYRMENFRTYIDQRDYIVRDGRPSNFFTSGQENESVQQVQHEILVQLARKGRADSITPILDVLRSERQREPLLITHRGVVVNGNRRLAAMRELFAEPGGAYSEFSHIDCMVLPDDATPEEIVDVEAALQGKRETKLDYDWIGDCQLIQRLMDNGRKQPEIADRLNRRISEVKNALAAFGEATIYLKDWAAADGEYGRVREAEQFFKDLPGLIQGKDQGLADASRLIAWNLFDNKEQLNDRIYVFNVVSGKCAAEAIDRIASELGVPLNEDAAEDDGTFAVDVDPGGSGSTSYQPIIDLFRDSTKRDEAVSVLIEVAQGIVEQERGRRSSGAALKAVIAANARLTEVDLGKADPSHYAAIGRQLEQIIKRSSDLQSVLGRLRGDGKLSIEPVTD